MLFRCLWQLPQHYKYSKIAPLTFVRVAFFLILVAFGNSQTYLQASLRYVRHIASQLYIYFTVTFTLKVLDALLYFAVAFAVAFTVMV